MARNYILELQDEKAMLREQLANVHWQLVQLQAYLQSSKFHGFENDYVHVRTDILPKIAAIRHMSLEV